jgi:Na+-translocating ferredoxin:NAD+ oxidoreductase RnfG subunit
MHLLALLLFAGLVATSARAAIIDDIRVADVRELFPVADKLGEVDVNALTRTVYSQYVAIGHVLVSSDIAPIPAYSGKPISALIGVDSDYTMVGVKLYAHEEPILVIGVTEDDIVHFLTQYRGLSVYDKVRVGGRGQPGFIGIDGITGATITVMVLNSSIMKAAQQSVEALKNGTEAKLGSYDDGGAWLQLWQQHSVRIGVLLTALLVLLAILFFQDSLVRHPQRFRRVRIAYLLFSVVFIGFYALAQLSIVNILAFIQIFSQGFTWDTLLLEPVVFILWCFVAISIIFWGRGVFCGWLCPFGALQELIGMLSERLGIKGFQFPPMVHERLWAIKYLILIALVGLSLDSLARASVLAEVEPFKTTFALTFQREWWFVFYALGLLVLSAFNSKFFCKYLCALGAALSFLTRFRIFDWLRRRKECGHPCQTCASDCSVGAIKPTGEIIENECHYCLECQVNYWDEHTCPPLVEKRKRREKRNKKAEIIARSATG